MESIVRAYFETEVNYRGQSYTVIYGEHVNGGWCCVPNWGVGCEMGSTDDKQFNAAALERAGLNPGAAKAIADKICVEGMELKAQGQLPEYGQIGDDYLRRMMGLQPEEPVLEMGV